jgi:hypothetical protein
VFALSLSCFPSMLSKQTLVLSHPAHVGEGREDETELRRKMKTTFDDSILSVHPSPPFSTTPQQRVRTPAHLLLRDVSRELFFRQRFSTSLFLLTFGESR